MVKKLWKGNEALAEAAVRAGLVAYFGYPITPQTELLEYLSYRMVKLDRTFLQAESELGAINMVYGAATTGVRTMTSSSSPGISLMQEGLSYIAASEVPVVLVDIMRGGPGLGNIQPSQGDYFQVTKSAGHGDFRSIVLAPATVQEAIDLVYEAFDLAEKYRTLVIVVADGNIGQMMEPAEMPPMREPSTDRPDWALTGAKGRPHNIITSLFLGPERLEALNLRLQEKINRIREEEIRFKEHRANDADILLVAFGTVGRISQTVVAMARDKGIKAGLFRPVSLFPFPYKRLGELAETAKKILVVEMNAGQMVEDVKMAVGRDFPVEFYGRLGGIVPLPDEVFDVVERIHSELTND
ncbi:MAG: 3-methyl-2-oxobutanoate dehydrogenase subunit VorB [Anaerolineales bacterium]|nr:3-methyl-2-oxobutanoate dehydrogenase subunit VorB [Anaerolineales bacterium]